MMIWDSRISRRITVIAVVCSPHPRRLVKGHSLCGDISLEFCECSLKLCLFLYHPLSSREVNLLIVISGSTSLLLITKSWSSPITYRYLMWRSCAFCRASPNVFGACLLLKYNMFPIDFRMGSMMLPKYNSIATVDLILLSWHPSTLSTKFW